MEKQLLRAAFQPIGSLASGGILGYEALIRGPSGSHLGSPIALFEQAQRDKCVVELERFAAQVCAHQFAQAQVPGKLFLNFSAESIREIGTSEGNLRHWLEAVQLAPERIVIELTESGNPEPLAKLEAALRIIRAAEVQLALDDYGAGHANLRLWSALLPDYVKIDRSIVDGVANSMFRIEALQHIQQLANAGHAKLIVEGIEAIEDLVACRDIGIPFAQGFFLGKPIVTPSLTLEAQALAVIRQNQ